MVRNIVGLPVESVKDIIASQDRNSLKISPAPSHGLYLMDVHYDRERRKIKEQKIIERHREMK